MRENYQNTKRALGIAVIIIVVVATALLQAIGLFNIINNFADIWIWIGGVLIGFSASLLGLRAEKKLPPPVRRYKRNQN